MTTAPLSNEDLLEFLECARYGETEDVQALLDAGADINFTDGSGNTALHRASANGHADVVKLLAERGAQYKANNSGNYPLHWAALNGHIAVAKLLMERYNDVIDVLAKNSFGKSALTDAINSGHDELARTVLAHSSADVSDQNRKAAAAAAGGAGGSSSSASDAVGDGEVEETEEEVGEEDQDLVDGSAQESEQAGSAAPAQS